MDNETLATEKFVSPFVPWFDAEVPEETESYQPISHKALVTLIELRLVDAGYTIIRHSVQQNISGTRAVGTFIVQRAGHDELTMMLAWTNSYDKSLAIKLASGASVFVCENGMIVGDVVALRKHTSNMLNDLDEMVGGVVANLEKVWKKTIRDVAHMKLVPMEDEDTAELYGRLFIIDKVITSTELNKAVNQLRNPTFIDFVPKNMWSTYNHVTWALKDAPPHRKLDCLNRLHEACMDIVNDYLAITPND